MVLYQVLKIMGQQDGLTGKAFAAKPLDLSVVLKTYAMEGENQLP